MEYPSLVRTEAHNNLGVLQRDVGCIPEALASYSRCLELDPRCRNAGQNRLLALNYIYPGEEVRRQESLTSSCRIWKPFGLLTASIAF